MKEKGHLILKRVLQIKQCADITLVRHKGTRMQHF